MEEHQPQSGDREVLVKIHNHLVDLKKLLVEAELARPGADQSLKGRLNTAMGSTEYIEAGGRETLANSERKVIAPTSDKIEVIDKADPARG